MLRMETEDGWWLITHPDHAALAAAFAGHWGNDLFAAPRPRENVLHGVKAHDNGWAARDAEPRITRQGKPAAFSQELVGKYSAFEEINLEDYLAVRERALQQVADRDAYAALLISMHTYNLLTERADRSSIAPNQLPLLDEFLKRQKVEQDLLHSTVRDDLRLTADETAKVTILGNFHLLQAVDNLSLLSCVAFMEPATLLHALATVDGGTLAISVEPLAPRHFRLDPYPFDKPLLTFALPARLIKGKTFSTSEELAMAWIAAPVQQLSVTVTA
jgi:hypothetical protein